MAYIRKTKKLGKTQIKRKRLRRLSIPKERFFLALFKIDRRKQNKVVFVGFCFSYVHAAECISGNCADAPTIQHLAEGKTQQFKKADLKGWFVVRMDMKWDHPIQFSELQGLTYRAHRVAEVKLGLEQALNVKTDELMRDETRTDYLREAVIRVVNPEEILIPEESSLDLEVDEFNTEEYN